MFSPLAVKFSNLQLADFLTRLYQPFSRQNIPDQKFVSTVFQDTKIYAFFIKKYFLYGSLTWAT